MKRIIFAATLVVVFLSYSVASAQVSKNLIRSGAIHDPLGAGNIIDGTDYYGSGNDDEFSEYGIATFNFTTGDFGGAALSSITQFDYVLTHNDRAFTDGMAFELFLTTDDLDATYSALSYDINLVNGLDTSQFTNISSLGVQTYDPTTEGGTMETINLSLSATQEADILNEIQMGSDFSIIIVATAAADDVTFTALNDMFEIGGQPILTINAGAGMNPDCVLGDVDRDGTVGFGDIAPFIALLAEGTLQCEADVDENGEVNFMDISPFIAILAGSQ